MFTMLNKWEIFVNQIYFIYFIPMETIKGEKKAEWKYRIIQVEDNYIKQTLYIPQKKNWLWIWRDLSYWKFFIEMAEDDIRKDKWEFKIVKYM